MSIAARILAGIVVEVAELPEGLTLAEVFHPDAGFIDVPDGVTVGMRQVDGEFLPALPPEPPPPAPLMPITRRQLRLTLLAHGVLDQVEPAIAALPEPERSIATIEWQDASEYRRDHPLIEQLGGALALDPAEIDSLWREAMAR